MRKVNAPVLVENKKYGKIYAKYDINEVLTTKRRCAKCRSIIPDNEDSCPSCKCTEIRSVEERITGWVGIQRFDDPNNFGIDLIRNGRAIRIQEKSAFFEFVDDFQNTIKDYPIDGVYGRIIGEINLDFVPVDFLKQDFVRSSEEWKAAISYLRGNSSLQPTKEGADRNTSIIFKLFQGYRKVRIAGPTDMYMGHWDKAENAPKRIPRAIEKEYYSKFQAKEPGYYDDEKWWELVEAAIVPPAPPMIQCEECGSQNLAEAEICTICGHIFKGKKCINNECGRTIPLSAIQCPHCNTPQIPEIEKPWKCNICGTTNAIGTITCKHCNNGKGAPNPLEENEAISHAIKDDELSIPDLSIKLAQGKKSTPFELNVYCSTNPLITPINKEPIPLILFKKSTQMDIVIDKTHSYFTLRGISPIVAISEEVASYIYEVDRYLATSPEHSISNIAWRLINKYWYSKMEVSAESVTRRCEQIMSSIKDQISNIIDDKLSDRYMGDMNDEQQKYFALELRKNNIPITKINELKTNGGFVRFVPNDFLLHILEESPELFFNGNYWTVPYKVSVPNLSLFILNEEDNFTLANYKNALELIVYYTEHKSSKSIELRRVDATLNFLQDNVNPEVL